jgi:hypothetical protein
MTTPRIASIAALLLRRCPPAIAWSVIAVDVDPVNAVIGRGARPHVRDECREIALPVFAHANTATAVVGILAVLFVVATLFRSAPAPVAASEGAVDRVPVRDVYVLQKLSTPTPARPATVYDKASSVHATLSAAGATTEHEAGIGGRNHSPSTELVSRANLLKRRHEGHFTTQQKNVRRSA